MKNVGRPPGITHVFFVPLANFFSSGVDFRRIARDEWIGKPRDTAARSLKIRYYGVNRLKRGHLCSVTASKLVNVDGSEVFTIILREIPPVKAQERRNFFLGRLGKNFNVELILDPGSSEGLYVDGFVAGLFQLAA